MAWPRRCRSGRRCFMRGCVETTTAHQPFTGGHHSPTRGRPYAARATSLRRPPAPAHRSRHAPSPLSAPSRRPQTQTRYRRECCLRDWSRYPASTAHPLGRITSKATLGPPRDPNPDTTQSLTSEWGLRAGRAGRPAQGADGGPAPPTASLGPEAVSPGRSNPRDRPNTGRG